MAEKKSVQIPEWIRTTMRILQTLSPRIATRFAEYLFFRPIRFPYPHYEKPYLDAFPVEKTQISNYEIAYYPQSGNGPRVALLHGWSGRATQLGFIAKELLEQGYDVTLIDGPAHGQSSGKSTHLLEFVDVIRALEQQTQPFDYAVGHSLGGLAFIVHHQRYQHLKKIVTIGSPGNIPDVIFNFCRMVGAKEKIGKYLIENIERKYQLPIDAYSSEDLVMSFQTPGLIIHDEDDYDVDVQDSRHVHNNWEGSDLLVTKGLGHRRVLFDQEVATQILSFFDE